jgi:ParB family chromosome partitioning protein
MAKGLGKGLSALIAEKPIKAAPQNADATSNPVANSNITKLPVDQLSPGKFQPRQYFKEDQLHELAESIRKNGVFQPIIVRKIANDKYEIIAGERRWRASKICGLATVPVIEMSLGDREALEIGIIENVQRQDLMVLEIADGYKRLMNEFSYTQEDLAGVIGKSRSAIANTMRLLALPDSVKDLINDEALSAGHARAILNTKAPEELAQTIVKRGLNVRQTEALVKKLDKGEIAPSGKGKPLPDPEIVALEKEISKKIGHQVSISNSGDIGKISISYSSLEELNTILHKLES